MPYADFLDREVVHTNRITCFDAADAASAFRYMQSGNHIGKIVIRIPEDPADLPTTTSLATPEFSSEKIIYYLVVSEGWVRPLQDGWPVMVHDILCSYHLTRELQKPIRGFSRSSDVWDASLLRCKETRKRSKSRRCE